MIDFDFRSTCQGCGFWCCKNEVPFVLDAELAHIGVERIGQKPNGDCEFLGPEGCAIHPRKPFECQMFPFDLDEVDGEPWWFLHEHSPAARHLPVEAFLSRFEAHLSAQSQAGYVAAYIAHHARASALKYDGLEARMLRPVRLSPHVSLTSPSSTADP